ncbi:MBL fold metallo-hydrolase [Sorangium sp. So ce128]|uniref:MBL fold metallo-hydrolase n=1 Tax=Sorangium sp. So ce128 TaxID=3133281 RepID=UPI003F605FF2
MELTYLGTATLVLRIGETRFLTDPVFDEVGAAYDFGPWFVPRSWFATEKRYVTPESPASLGSFDAVLLSHDHHADNLDLAGRALVADEARVGRVVTTVPSARRLARPAATKDAPGCGLGLGGRAVGLAPGAKTRVGPVTVTTIVARHGPGYAPQAHEVTGFLVDVDDGPRVWISGDTVLFPALEATLAEIRSQRPVDLAVVHCGAVGFPRAPGFRRARFTFDAAEAIAACRMLDAKIILPIHRSGWAHFQQSEDDLRGAFVAAGLEERTRFLDLGGTLEL